MRFLRARLLFNQFHLHELCFRSLGDALFFQKIFSLFNWYSNKNYLKLTKNFILINPKVPYFIFIFFFTKRFCFFPVMKNFDGFLCYVSDDFTRSLQLITVGAHNTNCCWDNERLLYAAVYCEASQQGKWKSYQTLTVDTISEGSVRGSSLGRSETASWIFRFIMLVLSL